MTAQRLSVLLTVFLYFHLVYSEILAQHVQNPEGENNTEFGKAMFVNMLSNLKIPIETTTLSLEPIKLLNITDATVDISNTTVSSTILTTSMEIITTTPSKTEPVTYSTDISNYIKLFERLQNLLISASKVLTEAKQIITEIQKAVPDDLPTIKRLQHLQKLSSTAKSFDDLRKAKKFRTTTVRSHYRRKMKKKKKPFKVATKKCKENKKKKMTIRTDDEKMEDATTKADLASIEDEPPFKPLHRNMYEEQKYFGKQDPWRHQVFKCWMYRLCYFGW